jgi:hypothetical protein
MVDIVRIKDRLAPRKLRPPGTGLEAVVLSFAAGPAGAAARPVAAAPVHPAGTKLPVQGPIGDGKPSTP